MLCSPEKHVAARARIKCCFWGAASAHHRYQNLDFQDQKMHLNCKDEVLAFWRQTYEICCPLKTHSMVPQPSLRILVICALMVEIPGASSCTSFISRHWAAYFAWDLAPLDRTLEEARGDGDSERCGKGGANCHDFTLIQILLRFYDTLCVTSAVCQKDPQWSREASTVTIICTYGCPWMDWPWS